MILKIVFTNGEHEDDVEVHEQHFEIKTELTTFHTQNMYPDLFEIFPVLFQNIIHICLTYLDFNEGKKLIQIPGCQKRPFIYQFPYRAPLYNSNVCLYCEKECYHNLLGIICVECDTQVCMHCLTKCVGFSNELSISKAKILFEKYLYCEFDGPAIGCFFQCYSSKVLIPPSDLIIRHVDKDIVIV